MKVFDYHLHSKVSFDSEEEPAQIVRAAEILGLSEICFTDHYDFANEENGHHDLFTIDEYATAYDSLKSSEVKIRRGVEFGMTDWNQRELNALLGKRDFDFVIGSVHFAGGHDPYFKEYWEGIDFFEAVNKYMTAILECVRTHDDFDVLGHLTYVCKSEHNPTHSVVKYKDIGDISDEIMKILVSKGKGMEVNTSGVDRAGDFLPSLDFVKRFRELGGEIITVGSDSHDRNRVGQYAREAIEMVGKVFPYVCTFEKRKPIFHKL